MANYKLNANKCESIVTSHGAGGAKACVPSSWLGRKVKVILIKEESDEA